MHSSLPSWIMESLPVLFNLPTALRSACVAGIRAVIVDAPSKSEGHAAYYERARHGWMERIEDGQEEAGFSGEISALVGLERAQDT
ncbi:hypothetical protein C8Q77DRAFT_233139 [Trametes polyzona]|nr:hypothetical protein C8Q77DRAFT_233139 [Trametes polyzona]